ncbi:MAG: tripartite tricarboxylate transporter TctB family protein [Pararhodobacter sp.]
MSAARDSNDESSAGPSGPVDLLAGMFFLAWAMAGWASYLGNAPLRRSLFAGADPGPALLPLILLWLISLGGVWLVLAGLWRWWAAQTQGLGLPAWRSHLAPAGFALSLLVLIWLMPQTGFRLPAAAFCLMWLWIMAPGGQALTAWALRLPVAAAIAFSLHFLFAKVLGVPLLG